MTTPPDLPIAATIGFQRRISAAIAAFGAVAAPAGAQLVIHVDDDAPPGGDGLTWQTALRTLREATDLLSAATNPMGPDTVLVGQGRYFVTDPIVGSTMDSLYLLSGVTVRGGFRGLTGPGDPYERDPKAFISVIDGDLGVQGDPQDNTRQAVRIMGTAGATIDGVTFRNVRGYPIRVFGSTGVTIARCSFEPAPGYTQGAIYAQSWWIDGSLVIDGCEFSGDDWGYSVIVARCGSVHLSNSRFIGTTTEDQCVLISDTPSVTVDGCTFVDNTAGTGSVVRIENAHQLSVRRVVVSGSTRGGSSRAFAPLHIGSVQTVLVQDCTLMDNSAGPAPGGAMSLLAFGDAVVERCVFLANSTSAQGGAIYASAPLRLSDCLLAGNQSGWTGGAVASSEPVSIARCTIADNVAHIAEGAGVHALAGFEIESSIVWANRGVGQPPASATFTTQVFPGASSQITDSVVTGIAGGVGNLAADPLFAGSGYQPQQTSPAINLALNPAASPLTASTDLAGNPRVAGRFVDAGCYELQHAPGTCGPADLATSAVRGLPGYRIADGLLSSADFFAFLEAYARADAAADLTTGPAPGAPGYLVPNGLITSDDFVVYLTLYQQGC